MSGDLFAAGRRGTRKRAAAFAVLAGVSVWLFQSASPARVDATSSAFATGKPVVSSSWCQARPDSAWNEALKNGVVSLSRRHSIIPWGIAGDGRTFFASYYSASYSGVVRITAVNGHVKRIKRFPDAVNDQADGTFDGRWLVWHEYHSLYDWYDFTTWSWDSHTGKVRQIGAAQKGPNGAYLVSSWRQPDARGGFAIWEQGARGPGYEPGDIHTVNLRSGRGRVIRHGHVEESFLLDGHRVVWNESMKPGALTVMRTANVKSGRIVTSPVAIRRMRGALMPATNGHALAFTTAQSARLWWTPALSKAARRVYTIHRKGYAIDNSLQVSDRYLMFGTNIGPSLYLADVVAGRYMKIGPGGWGRLGAKSLLLVRPSNKKALHGISDTIFVPLAALPPIPECRK